MLFKYLKLFYIFLLFSFFVFHSAVAQETALTTAEWLKVIKKQGNEEKLAWSPEYSEFMKGAAIALHSYKGTEQGRKRLNKEEKRLYGIFLSFMKEKGSKLFAELEKGIALSDDDEKYYYLINGLCFSEYLKKRLNAKKKDITEHEQWCISLSQKVEKQGMNILKKGYLGEKLTPDDIRILRLYALFIEIRCCGNGVLPFHLGLTRNFNVGPGRPRFKEGEKAPDFNLPKMEAYLNSPEYTDKNPYNPTDIFTSLILREYMLAMQGYKKNPDKDSKEKVIPIFTPVPEDKKDMLVKLSSFRGKKPVLFVLGDPSDSWCWHWKIAPMFAPLYQAYKDKIEFFTIHSTVHDTHMPVKDFLAKKPGWRATGHDLTYEQRARVCKMFYMNWPQFTFDYLMDDNAQHTRNAYMDQGGGAYIILIDLEGNVAFIDYHQHWPKGKLSFYDETIFIRLNHLESRLSSFFKNGSIYSKEMDTPLPGWRRSPQIDNAVLKTIEGNRLTAELKGKTYSFEISPGCRIMNNYEILELGKLKPGDKITISYIKDKNGMLRARWIHSNMSWVKKISTIWLSGKITEIDAKAKIITVQAVIPPAKKMKGLQFWNKAKDIKPYDKSVETRLNVVKRWATSKNSLTYKFKIDDAVIFFLNGKEVKITALKVGDSTGVLYHSFDDKNKVIYPRQIRGTRLHE